MVKLPRVMVDRKSPRFFGSAVVVAAVAEAAEAAASAAYLNWKKSIEFF